MYSGSAVRPRNRDCHGSPDEQAAFSTRATPLHRKALGLFANIGADSQDMLSNHTIEIGPEVCRIAGLDFESAYDIGIYNVRYGHRITVAPITQIGNAMFKASDSRLVPLYPGSERMIRTGDQFDDTRRKVARIVTPFSGIAGLTDIVDFDWYGRNENVFVAKIDPHSTTYHRLLDAQAAVQQALDELGLKDCKLNRPDHITLLRTGSNRRPIDFGDRAKDEAISLSREKITKNKSQIGTDGHTEIGSVSVLGLSIIEPNSSEERLEPVFGNPKPNLKRRQ